MLGMKVIASLALICLSTFLAVGSPLYAQESSPTAPSVPPSQQRFFGFSEARGELIRLISSSTARVWLVTPFLSDGEVAAALYVAQYRKIDVKALLEKFKANAYMSRLDFLKKQNIPVFLKPDSFKPPVDTVLLIDDSLYYFTGELDFLAKTKEFTLTKAPEERATVFEAEFRKAFESGIAAIPHPIRLVGRPRPNVPGAYSGGSRGVYRSRANYSPEEVQGSFSYDFSKPQPRPPGVPSNLPRETVFQKKTKVKKKETSSASDQLGNQKQDGILDAGSNVGKEN